MYKAVVFARVSTDEQNTMSQIDTIRKYALENGYSENDLYSIEYKESGSGLEDDDRERLVELKHTIKHHPIETVFVTELSRLSRRTDTLHSLKKLFEKRKIQLKVKEGSLQLLNNGKNRNDSTSLMFAIYAEFAEIENKNRIERFRNGKMTKAASSGFTGGTRKFGYKIVQIDEKTKKYEICEKEGKIVFEAFELYKTGKYGNVPLLL
jgi:DNA invertase Pin-like site-specific DNA recombinase